MNIWNIPYVDLAPPFWDEITAQFGEYIRSVYFPMQNGGVASGRPQQPDQFLNEFLNNSPLSKTVLVNPIIFPRPAEQMAPAVIAELMRLGDEHGVNRVTVSNLTLARLIKEALPNYKVGASILMGISTPAQVLMIQGCVDSIVLDNRLLRDLFGLQRIRRTYSGDICLIVNEACLPGCPYRTQHFYEMGYGRDFPQSLCQEILNEHPWLRLTGAWILPQHLVYYEGLYDSLKLAGRVTLRDQARYYQVLDAYIHRKKLLPRDIGGGPASILDHIDMPDKLFEKILHCEKNCFTCTVCRDYYERAAFKLQVE